MPCNPDTRLVSLLLSDQRLGLGQRVLWGVRCHRQSQLYDRRGVRGRSEFSHAEDGCFLVQAGECESAFRRGAGELGAARAGRHRAVARHPGVSDRSLSMYMIQIYDLLFYLELNAPTNTCIGCGCIHMMRDML